MGPLAFPHVVPFGVKLPHFLLGFVVDILHGAITERQMGFVPHGITLGTTVPETPMEFVGGIGFLTVAIHGEGGTGHAILAGIAHVLNVMALGWMRMVWVGTCHHQVVSFQVFVIELLQGFLAQLVIAPV